MPVHYVEQLLAEFCKWLRMLRICTRSCILSWGMPQRVLLGPSPWFHASISNFESRIKSPQKGFAVCLKSASWCPVILPFTVR